MNRQERHDFDIQYETTGENEMSDQEKHDLVHEMETLRNEIVEKVEALVSLIRSADTDHEYTALLIESNVYSLLGANGHYNQMGDAQQVIDELAEYA